MKTALTEFLEVLKFETEEYYKVINNEKDYHYEDIQSAKLAVADINNLLEKGSEFLKKERNQIISAFEEGKENYNEDSQDTISSETYYLETYHND